MAALTAPYDARRKDSDVTSYPVAATTECFKGGLAVLSAGYAQPGADAAGVLFAGVFAESADNLSGAVPPGQVQPSIGSPLPNLPSGLAAGVAGAINVRVVKEGAFVFSKAAAVQGDVGKEVFVVDDNTVSVAATTNNIFCGYVTELIDSSHVRVRIDRAVQ